MKKILSPLLIVALFLAMATTASAEMVLNYTSCTATNNLGVGVNTYGQSFIFNASAGNTYISSFEFYFANITTAGTQFPAGTTFRARLHYNESLTNSTVLWSQDVTSQMQSAGAASAGCNAGGSMKNISLTGFGALNLTGNYTFDIEVQGEGANAQWWEFVNGADPYTLGHEATSAFIAGNDQVFRVYATTAPASVTYTFNITARDTVSNVALTTFNASVQNSTGTFYFSTTNGTINTNVAGTNTEVLNITVNATNYFSNSSINYNSTRVYQANLTQWTALYVNDNQGNLSLSTYSVNYTNTTGTFTGLSTVANVIYLPLYGANWNVSIQSISNAGINYTGLNVTLNATTFLRNYTAYTEARRKFNITLNDAVTGVALTTFNASINDGQGTIYYTTSNGTINTNFWYDNAALLNITLNASNYFTNASTNYRANASFTGNMTQWTAIYAKALAGGTDINTFSINYTNLTATYTVLTTTGVVYIPLYNGSWNITIFDASEAGTDYAMDEATFNASLYFRNYTFYLFTTNSFNFTFRDEITGAILYSNLVYGTDLISVELLGDLISYNYSANGTLYVDLLTPQDYVIRYQKPNFGRLRSYFITLTNQSNYNIDLYLLNDTISSDLTVTVYDRNTLNTIQGAVVYLERFNVTCNCYLVVAMGETDVEGNTYFDVEQSEELYKFIVDYPWNTIRFTSDPLYIEVTQLNLYISLTGELLGGFFNSTGITGQIYYTNTTGGEFNIVYNDPTASATQYCLTVKSWNQYDKDIVNVSCSSSPSGSFSLGGLTEAGKTYFGVFTAYIDGQNVTVKTVWEEIPSTSLGATQFGIFLSLGLFLILIFLSQLHIMGLILGAFSLFISKAIGILPVSWGMCTAVFISSLIIALMLDKR